MERRAEHESLFEDADFPAKTSSLALSDVTPIFKLQGVISWLRPQEICKSPQLFPPDLTQAHAKQGVLGDCWLLCACTMLLKSKHLMDQVLPQGQPQWGQQGYDGSFLLRFWQRGGWVEVRVDDRLPCIDNKLCFSQCLCPSAFWVALLEKAYAKLHGSYEALWAGQVSEALVDLSGGVAERWSLPSSGEEEEEEVEVEEEEKRGDAPPARRRRRRELRLSEAVREACAVSCSFHRGAPGETGVSEQWQYHALSVLEWTDVQTVSGETECLLRIRNPWGRRCWNGAWTENGTGWNTLELAVSRQLLSSTKPGEFWVNQKEFQEEFDDVTVGYPITSEGHLQSIYTGGVLSHLQQVRGRWVRGESAGGCRNSSSYGSNPKFWLRVAEPAEVVACLLQYDPDERTTAGLKGLMKRDMDAVTTQTGEGGRGQERRHQHAIGLHMWKIEKKHLNLSRTLNKPPCACTHSHAYEREVVMQAQLSAGFHLLIPSTFQQGAQAGFLLRVYCSSPASLSAVRTREAAQPCGSEGEGEWESSSFHGSWTPGVSAGGSRNFPSHRQNPHFLLTVTYDPGATNVRVTLRQNCPESKCQAIGFHIYKVLDDEDGGGPLEGEPVESCVPHCYAQEVSLVCSLRGGDYSIVPSTYQPDLTGHFTLTVARRIHRKVVQSQENLGRAIKEVSHISVMRC
ncbi:calpain-10 [Engraulis encrasicolus]|uniref:calpain-10 n=1 Tax=Engraulis encrasicolus TaxID=184585 RepID=UPI002FD7979A